MLPHKSSHVPVSAAGVVAAAIVEVVTIAVDAMPTEVAPGNPPEQTVVHIEYRTSMFRVLARAGFIKR